ncbi:twin-arginine translocation signal domain-containing protein [Streptomyces sp. NPDC097610]|uniref:twin-arginine translocation signal domain-containing protein n=1 Tax=Streptomyces sp. NPDC097610 TaxID=3157227 RepID=UPI00332311E1
MELSRRDVMKGAAAGGLLLGYPGRRRRQSVRLLCLAERHHTQKDAADSPTRTTSGPPQQLR